MRTLTYLPGTYKLLIFVGAARWAWLWRGATDSTSRALPLRGRRMSVSWSWRCYSGLAPCVRRVLRSGGWSWSRSSLRQLGSDGEYFAWRPVSGRRAVHWSRVRRRAVKATEFRVSLLSVPAQAWLRTAAQRSTDARRPSTLVRRTPQHHPLDAKFTDKKSPVPNVSPESRLSQSLWDWGWIFRSSC